MAENTISTVVKEVSFDDVVAEFDKDGGSAAIEMIPKEDSSAFQDALDKPEEKKESSTITETTTVAPEILESVLDKADNGTEEEEEEEEEEEKPDVNKAVIDALELLIEEGELYAFDEDKKLKEYTKEDIVELLKANREHQRSEDLEAEISEFFQSLPKELQYAAKYVTDGGTDLKNLFKALAATEEIKALDTNSPAGQEAIVREYYRSIDWGSDEEIEEELERLRESGQTEMKKVADKFKPKLEKNQEELTKQHLARQEKARALQEQEMQSYLDNAHEAIKSGKLGTVQLDKKTQTQLWAGLTQPSHQTRRGAATNELGHLLEKYQYIEPDFEKMYKVLWLLRDEEGFMEAHTRKAVNENVSANERTLRTEQSKKKASGKQEKEKDSTVQKNKGPKTIPRPGGFLGGLK